MIFFALTETELNSSFPTSQFAVENYVINILDRPNNLEGGGGILCYINFTIPNRMRADLAYNQDSIESMVIEITVKQKRWFFVVLYRPPNVSVNYLKSAMDYTNHKCLEQAEVVFLLGDLNIDFGKDINPLSDILGLYGIENMIKGPTCFKSVSQPTRVDVILTNVPKRVRSILNTDIGVSDFHNLTLASTKLCIAKMLKRNCI